MGISIDPTPPVTRYGGAIKPAIEAIQKIFSGSYVDAAFKLGAKPTREPEVATNLARSRCEQLAKVADSVLRDGFPAHETPKGVQPLLTWRQREVFQRNAEKALYALIHAWADVDFANSEKDDGTIEKAWNPGPIKVEWTTPCAADAIMARLGDRWPIRRVFQRWDFGNQDLFWANLMNANLCGANLSEVNRKRCSDHTLSLC